MENVHLIKKMERSVMTADTIIHRRPAAELLMEDQRNRFFTASSRLELDSSGQPEARK